MHMEYTAVLAEEYEYRELECEEAHKAVHSLKFGDARLGFYCTRYLEALARRTEIEKVMRILDSAEEDVLKKEYMGITNRAEVLSNGMASARRGRNFFRRQYLEASAAVSEFETVMHIMGIPASVYS